MTSNPHINGARPLAHNVIPTEDPVKACCAHKVNNAARLAVFGQVCSVSSATEDRLRNVSERALFLH